MDQYPWLFLGELFLPILPFIHRTRIHSPVPRRGALNESRDSVLTLCCKKALFLPTVSSELPLCCLNVYMEQLEGSKTDVWSKNTAPVQSLLSLDDGDDTILTAFFQMPPQNDTLN